MNKRLLYICHQAPYNSFASREALDAILASAAFGQKVSVLFKGDGVFQLLASQNAATLERKNLGAILSSFSLYDIKDIFVCQHSVLKRGLEKHELIVEVETLESAEMQTLLSKQDHILSF